MSLSRGAESWSVIMVFPRHKDVLFFSHIYIEAGSAVLRPGFQTDQNNFSNHGRQSHKNHLCKNSLCQIYWPVSFFDKIF